MSGPDGNDARRGLVEQWLASGTAAQPAKRPTSAGTGSPSAAQRRLWFAEQLLGGSVYNVASAWIVRGSLDLDALGASFAALSDRHSELRIALTSEDGEPVRRVTTERLALKYEIRPDLHEDNARLKQLIDSEAAAPFDLGVAPLARARLVKIAADEHLLTFTVHHLLVDAVSMGLLMRDLERLYANRRSDDAPAVPLAPAAAYDEFIGWERTYTSSAQSESDLSYWKAALTRVAGTHDLVGRAASEGVEEQSRRYRFELDEHATAGLRWLAEETGNTLFIALLGVYTAILRRFSLGGDVSFATVVDNRPTADFADVVGQFANTVILRPPLEGSATLRQALATTREVVLDALTHKALPFDSVVRELSPSREGMTTPFTQLGFTLQPEGVDRLNLAGVRCVETRTDRLPALFHLIMSAAEDAGRLKAEIHYRVDRFDETTIELLASQIEACARGARRFVDEAINLLPTTVDPPPPVRTAPEGGEVLTLSDLLRVHAHARPDQPALRDGQNEWTFGELDRRVDDIAEGIRAAGTPVHGRVGIRQTRSMQQVASVLGVLRSGCAYVPVDAAHPLERQQLIRDDSGLQLMLEDDASASDEVSPKHGPVFPRSRASDEAYVMYTSGTTGRPRGVVVDHGGIANLTEHLGYLRLSPDDRVGLFASMGFDASVWELAMWLGSGCQAHLLGATEDRAAFAEELARASVTVVTGPPSAIAQIDPVDTPALRVVISAGEPCPPSLPRRWLALGRRFINAYGPTEVTVCATVGDTEADEGRPSIGRPIKDTAVRILDALGRRLPPGMPGEIAVSGPGIAAGYHGLPALTAARFVPDPDGRAGERMYLTGDVGWQRPDGRFDFARRTDAQVKVRGHRIELTEVEAHLDCHPGVSAVATRVTDDGEAIAAFVVPMADADWDELRVGLQALAIERLPAYMLPSVYHSVERLPVGPTGKVDRNQLVLPTVANRQPAMDAASAVEAVIVDAWRTALGVDGLGLDEDVFALGAHSLLVTKVVGELRRRLDGPVDVRAVFAHPTARQLAEHLQTSR